MKGKPGVLRLLADIATLDEPERFALCGFDSRARLRGLPPLWVRSVDAVNAGAQVYRRLLASGDPAVRAAAAYLLAWLEREAANSVPAL
ncbi:MAG: hypothetical protein JNK82_37975 [Myxococcaceae bacterium]|nr:hypothetical protein [Myxococcaceae bacterium]